MRRIVLVFAVVVAGCTSAGDGIDDRVVAPPSEPRTEVLLDPIVIESPDGDIPAPT